MSAVAAIGEPWLVDAFAFAGVLTVPAQTREQVLEAWRALGPEVALVILTPRAGAVLGEVQHGDGRLWAVMPG